MRTLLQILILLAVSTLASADNGISMPTPTAAAAGTYAHDLFALFGSFGETPWLNVGRTDTLLGRVFLIMNTFLFSLGACWSSFTWIGATVQTAHEGEFLGKRYSTVWLPIRMVLGMSMLVPILGGYSIAQGVMMSGALMGNSVADSAYNTLISSMATGTALVSPAAGTVTTMGAGKGSDALIEQMFQSSACVAYNNAMAAKAGSAGGYARTTMGTTDGSESLVLYGTPALLGIWQRAECGKVTITKKGSSAHTSINSVNYDAISSQIYQSTVTTVQSLSVQVDVAAKQWVDAVTGNGSFEPDQMNTVAVPDLAPLKAQFVTQLATARQQAFSNGLPAITADAQANMKQGGWMAAGSWYGTIAMETDVLREATDGAYGYTAPTSLNATFAHDLQQALSRTRDSSSPAAGGSGGTSAESHAICSLLKSVTPTGNCSIGQALTSYLISATATSGGGLFGAGSAATVSPILSMKSMGDYLLIIGDTIQVASWAAKKFGGDDEDADATEKPGVVGRAGKAIIGKALSWSGISSVISLLSPLAMPLILLGLLMSIYIPMIPFLAWVGALISYATVVIEAIAAAPLWAMAHLDPNGDGMGQRSGHGYLFLLNVLLRPILMLIGFVAASALIIVLGTIIYQMFTPAMANVQGNSVTGLWSALALLALFWLVNFILIQGACNMVTLVPDQVLNWLGSVGQSHLGKEMEQKVYGLMFSAAATARGMITGAAGASQAGNAAKKETQRHQQLMDAFRSSKKR